MEEVILEAQLREELGRAKVKDLREKGFIPAVVYAEGEVSRAIKISRSEVFRLLREHRLESTVINLKVNPVRKTSSDGTKLSNGVKEDKKQKARACLIKEVQYDPVFGDIVHIDFNEISLTKVIRVNVPVVAKGEPIGVKQEGGSLEHILWEVEVECLPTEIPKEIAVDVSNLKIGEAIHVRDISFALNVKVLTDPGAVVLSVSAPIKEEVPVAPIEGEAAMQEPEVIKEKKEMPAEGAEEEKAEGKGEVKKEAKEKK